MRKTKIFQSFGTFAGVILLLMIIVSCERTDYELLDPESAGLWTHYDTGNGLPGNTVTDIRLDSKDNLWLTFSGQGIAKYINDAWTNYRTSNSLLLSNNVTCLDVSASGSIIFGTPAGLSTLSVSDTWDSYPSATMTVTSVKVASDGAIWVGTANNGFYVNTGGGYVNTFSETYKTVNVIEEDRAGNIWIGTTNGLLKWNGTAYTYLTVKDGLPDNSIKALYQDRKRRLWIGTDGGKTASWIDGKGLHQLSLLNGRDSNHINDIFEDRQGNIWFATASDGLIMWNGIIPSTYRTADSGLPENTILSIGEDKYGNVWFGLASKGAVKYTLPIN